MAWSFRSPKPCATCCTATSPPRPRCAACWRASRSPSGNKRKLGKQQKSPAVAGRAPIATAGGGSGRDPCALPGQARPDEPLGVAVGQLDVGIEAPVAVELPLRAETAVEVAVVVVAVLVTGQRVAFQRR